MRISAHRRRARARLLQSVAVIVVVAAPAGVAQAQTANVTGSTVNVLNLLSPFLSLNSTTIGQQTLTQSLSTAISINNNATTAQQQLAISDENLISSATFTVRGSGQVVGVAANLGGGIAEQTISTGTTPATITGMQNTPTGVGGLGTQLGAIYDTGVAGGTGGSVGNAVSLLTAAYTFTSANFGVAKNYFANGTYNGTTAAVAPSGYTLPTYNGLPNTTNSVYDLAYGVTNTGTNQNPEGDSRPYQVTPAGTVTLYDPTIAIPGGSNSLNTNPAFPSGHTTYAYTDSILIAMMVPQEYQSMLLRASEYANSRIVLGAHYPLDIIASRSLVQYDLAQALTNTLYQNNAAMTGTAIDLQTALPNAASQMQTYLASQCGASVATCATSSANTTNDPYVASAANQATYDQRLTYGLPTLTFAQAPREQAPAGGPDASILLAPIYGGSTSAALTIAPNGGTLGSLQTGTINQIIVNTETNALAAFYGTSLSYWARIDLYTAAQYFQGVTGTITLASTDQVNTNVVVASQTLNVNNDIVPAGVLAGTGTVNGNVQVQSGGTVGGGSPGAPGTLTINGNLQLSGGSNYLVQMSPGAAGRTNVSGTATIASGAQAAVYFAPGVYNVGSKFDVLTTAANGLSGTFSGLSYNTAGINVTPVLSYTDPQDAYITLVQAQIPTLPSGAPANASNIANTLNAYIADPPLPAELQNLYGVANLAATLNSLGNQTGVAANIGVQNAMNTFMHLMFDLGSEGHSSGATVVSFAPDAEPQLPPAEALAYSAVKNAIVTKAPPAYLPHWDAWTAGFGGESHIDGNATLGSQTLNTSLAGGAMGLDYYSQGGATFGASVAGGDTNFNLANGFGTGHTNFGQGALYAKQDWGPFYVDGAVAGGAHSVSSDRTVTIGPAVDSLSSSFTASTLAERAEAGYHYAVGHYGAASYFLTPYGAVQAQTIWTPTYTESVTSGVGATANTSLARTYTDPRTELGGWLDAFVGPNGTLIRGRAAWVHDYNINNTVTDTFAALPGTSFVVNGPQRPADAALLTAMAEVPVWRSLVLSAKFDAELAGGATIWSGMGMVRYVW